MVCFALCNKILSLSMSAADFYFITSVCSPF